MNPNKINVFNANESNFIGEYSELRFSDKKIWCSKWLDLYRNKTKILLYDETLIANINLHNEKLYFSYEKYNINIKDFNDDLMNKGYEKIFETNQHTIKDNIVFSFPCYQYFIHKDYPFYLFLVYFVDAENENNERETYIYPYSITVIYEINNANTLLTNKILNDFNQSIYKNLKNVSNSEISLISIDGRGNYYLNNKVIKSPVFTDLDIHYGKGFSEFYDNLLERLKTTSKGLVILYGDPGTGKSQTIRKLIYDLGKKYTEKNKRVVYLSPKDITFLLDANFITFLCDLTNNKNDELIFVIEDGEPLLQKREDDDRRTIGISNLLNITDGILNDILRITVIVTFNTKLENIDNALLRNGRLVSIKEFSAFQDKTECIELLTKLNLQDYPFQYPLTLSDIYSVHENKEIIRHNIIEKKQHKIGF
jgi:hypothetical protein